MRALNLDILGVAETRWTSSGIISERDYEMIYSGGDQHQYGVGIMMKKNIAAAMSGFWPYSDRIIMIQIRWETIQYKHHPGVCSNIIS